MFIFGELLWYGLQCFASFWSDDLWLRRLHQSIRISLLLLEFGRRNMLMALQSLGWGFPPGILHNLCFFSVESADRAFDLAVCRCHLIFLSWWIWQWILQVSNVLASVNDQSIFLKVRICDSKESQLPFDVFLLFIPPTCCVSEVVHGME